ncbi:unnamed protein product [Tetraodon nigroviridis]|uniref:(spotted green pufferfish) hypothetical protein n=1 Tax=Tetraodon nigroviridis TaxID=99883 RepID=Q4SJY9_TETNG|nr:unnamed protein product [Tetraodon nigroviridis]
MLPFFASISHLSIMLSSSFHHWTSCSHPPRSGGTHPSPLAVGDAGKNADTQGLSILTCENTKTNIGPWRAPGSRCPGAVLHWAPSPAPVLEAAPSKRLWPQAHVASTPPWTHTSPSLPFGHRQPLYRLTPAAKICVCTANGGPAFHSMRSPGHCLDEGESYWTP